MDINEEVILKYNIDSDKNIKGRGYQIYFDNTDNSSIYKLYFLKGSIEKAEAIEQLVKKTSISGDEYIRNKEGNLVTVDEYEDKYILKRSIKEGTFDIKSIKDIETGARTLAKLHIELQDVYREKNEQNTFRLPKSENIICEYERHNVELKRIRNFLRTRKQKNKFEQNIYSNIGSYIEIAIKSTEKLKSTKYEELEEAAHMHGCVCHGEYNHHTVLIGNGKVHVIDFENAGTGIQIKDLYFYIRKILEKHDWNVELGRKIVKSYNDIKRISDDEKQIMKVMLMYPEKFWKVLNQYYNSSKSQLFERNVLKMNKVYEQQDKKEQFIINLWNF